MFIEMSEPEVPARGRRNLYGIPLYIRGLEEAVRNCPLHLCMIGKVGDYEE